MWLLTVFLIYLFVVPFGNGSYEADKRRNKLKVVPEKYYIELHPDLQKGVYNGIVNITLNIKKPTNTIYVHSKNLDISKVVLDIPVSFKRAPKSPKTKDILQITVPQVLQVSKVNLIVYFSGQMSPAFGFIRGFDYSQGKKKYFAFTRFKLDGCRKVYPCFDEPHYKAVYVLNVTVSKGVRTVLSNAEIETMVSNDKKKSVIFKPTKPIAPSEFTVFMGNHRNKSRIITHNGTDITIGIYSPPPVKQYTWKIIRALSKSLHYLFNYFDLTPLDKLEIVTINEKFHPKRGIAHLGIVTVRNTDFIMNSSDVPDEKSLLVAQYVAQMFFGGLVTPCVWEDVWFVYGLTKFFSIKVGGRYPSSNANLSALVNDVHNALVIDSNPQSSRTLLLTPNEVEKINKYEDFLTSKGAGVLLMLEKALGERQFKRIIKSFIRKYSYQSADQEDFIKQAQNFVSFNFSEFLNSWTNNTGYPVIFVRYQKDKNNNKFTVQQKPFHPCPDNECAAKRWVIPVTFVSNLNTTPTTVWFDTKSDEITITLRGKLQWIKFNYQQQGFYRVVHDDKLLANLKRYIEKLTVFDRINLIDDAYALFDKDLLSCNDMLDLTKHLKKEYTWFPWFTANTRIFTPLAEIGAIKKDLLFKYIRYSISNVYAYVGWDNSTQTETDDTSRAGILNLACFYGYEPCLTKAAELLPNVDSLPPLIQEIVKTYGKPDNSVSTTPPPTGSTPKPDSTKYRICNQWLEKEGAR